MIGTSNPSFDDDVERFIRSNFDTSASILDVGPGAGKYGRMLHDYPNKDCIEANPKCFEMYPLGDIYKTCWQGTFEGLELPSYDYDLVIMGDVLEHVEVADAQRFISKLKCGVLIKVPLMAPRGPSFGTHLEAHPQGDLTVENFLERYPGSIYLFGDTTEGHKRSQGDLRIATFYIPPR